MSGEQVVKNDDAVRSRVPCFVCGSTDYIGVFGKTEVNNYRLAKCDDCGMVRAFELEERAQPHDYSEYGDYLLLDKEAIRGRVYAEKQRRRSLFRMLKRKFSDDAVLDFGSGAGYFCKAAEEDGLNCYGLEISNKLVEFCHSTLGFHRVFRSLDEIHFQFSAIFMFDVIEHLNPVYSRQVLERLTRFLRPGGMLIGNTPNFVSANVRICKYKDPVVAPPSHLCYFTPVTLDRYFGSLGLRRFTLYTRGFSSNSFFRKKKFEISVLEKSLRAAKLYQLPLIISLRLMFDALGYLVGPLGLGYQIYFVYLKP